MTYAQAVAKLPADAFFSSSFGYPGEAGYSEIHRDPNGNRWMIDNGKWDDDDKIWNIHPL